MDKTKVTKFRADDKYNNLVDLTKVIQYQISSTIDSIEPVPELILHLSSGGQMILIYDNLYTAREDRNKMVTRIKEWNKQVLEVEITTRPSFTACRIE